MTRDKEYSTLRVTFGIQEYNNAVDNFLAY